MANIKNFKLFLICIEVRIKGSKFLTSITNASISNNGWGQKEVIERVGENYSFLETIEKKRSRLIGHLITQWDWCTTMLGGCVKDKSRRGKLRTSYHWWHQEKESERRVAGWKRVAFSPSPHENLLLRRESLLITHISNTFVADY